jgi:hypothetical protein
VLYRLLNNSGNILVVISPVKLVVVRRVVRHKLSTYVCCSKFSVPACSMMNATKFYKAYKSKIHKKS